MLGSNCTLTPGSFCDCMLGIEGPNAFAVAIASPPANNDVAIPNPVSVPAAAKAAAKPAHVIAPVIAAAIAVNTAIL